MRTAVGLSAITGLGLLLTLAACATGKRTEARSPQAPAATGDARLIPQTGAVTTIVEDQESGVESLRIDEYLKGRIPGLQVISTADGGFTLRLRGGHTSAAGTSNVPPLVIIDGAPIEPRLLSRVLFTLRPRDIKRIDVLRDLASTSVYGMRAAGGVILISTIGT
jgi:TonB-dependent SusC/RagA subfamily outer membrane receptor